MKCGTHGVVRPHPSCAARVWRLLLAPALALADPAAVGPSAIGLHWSDAVGLAPTTEDEFDAQLTERLGRPAFSQGQVADVLSVAWQGSPEQCQVQLSLVRGSQVEGTRLIESPNGDCDSLVPALLTVAALLVESRQTALAREAALATPAAVTPSEPSAPSARPATPGASSSSPPPLALLSLGASLSSGFAPKLELGPAAVVAWSPVASARIGAAGALFFGHQYGENPGMSLAHGRAALLVCGMPVSARVGLGLCGNVALHHFSAAGISLPRAEAHSLSTWSVGAELRAEWRLTRRFWWVGQAGADWATRPLHFYHTTATGARSQLFEQRRINPGLLLALSLELP